MGRGAAVVKRRSPVATAALRAAVAWSRRDSEPGAWGEVARMTGVVMHAQGPLGSVRTPADLVAALHRPLRELLPVEDHSPALAGVVLLEPDDSLADAALEVAGDYAEALFDGADPATDWLPRWSWQRAEQVQRQVFQDLLAAGDEQVYTASRRFLVEHPSGDLRELIDLRNQANARSVASYLPIPGERVHRFGRGEAEACWWPCPVCRWPMRVHEDRVWCTYPPHGARFLIDRDSCDEVGRPELLSAAERFKPAPQSVINAQCVEEAVWRYVTVPGIPEVELERRLHHPDRGLQVVLYPMKDTYDAIVTSPGRRWTVDVKDHADPLGIATDPPRADHIVVPSYRRGQVNLLSRLLPDKKIWTLRQFCTHVLKAVPEKTA